MRQKLAIIPVRSVTEITSFWPRYGKVYGWYWAAPIIHQSAILMLMPNPRSVADRRQGRMRLRRTKDLWEYTIGATDADIGTVHDFYFDDEKWTIRYIVVETGAILPGRKVLISPTGLRERAWSPLHIWVNLTPKQVRSSPSVLTPINPISRQDEIEHHNHYGWPYYWPGKGIWGSLGYRQRLPKRLEEGRQGAKDGTLDGRSLTQYERGDWLSRLGNWWRDRPRERFSF